MSVVRTGDAVVAAARLGAIRLQARAESIDALTLPVEMRDPPRLTPGEALVRVASAAVNPSDVKAALGNMPQARFPRTPGRDFAGTVHDGPTAWVGRKVWGSGGDIGITRDGSHAGWLALPVGALREMPSSLSFDEAGAVGVPFVTALEGYRRCGMPQSGQTVAVMGANGKVGQAAVQLAAQAGARVIAVQRGAASRPPARSAGTERPAESAFVVVDAMHEDVAARLRELSGGRGVDIVYNTVGSVYFAGANAALAKGGTQIFIATTDRAVPFDIFAFYRGMHTYVGIDSLALDATAAAERLDVMKVGFEAGALMPYAVGDDCVYSLDRAGDAYRRVFGGATARVVLRP